MKEKIGWRTFAILSALLSCSQKKTTNGDMPKNATTYRQGRFAFQLPTDFQPMPGLYTIKETDVEFLPGNISSFHDIWAHYLADIGKRKEYRELKNDKIGDIVSTNDIAPNFRTAVYHYFENPAIVTCGGLLATDNIIVKLTLDVDQDKKHAALDDLLAIAREYMPNGKKDDIFFTDYGGFDTEGKLGNETSQRYFRDTLHGLSFTFETRKLHNDKEDDNFRRGNVEKIAISIFGKTGGKLLRKKNRVVGGIKGRERIVSYHTKDENNIFFSFQSKGRPGSMISPNVRITLESDLTDVQRKISLWDAILNSIRPSL